MTSGLLTRRIAIAAAGAALAAVASLTACSPAAEKQSPTSSTTPATSAPSSSSTSLTPSEKAVGPGVTDSFSPTVRAGQPGAVCQQLVNGVCVR